MRRSCPSDPLAREAVAAAVDWAAEEMTPSVLAVVWAIALLRLERPFELEMMLEPELELELVGDVLPDVTGEGEEGVAAVPYVCRMA